MLSGLLGTPFYPLLSYTELALLAKESLSIHSARYCPSDSFRIQFTRISGPTLRVKCERSIWNMQQRQLGKKCRRTREIRVHEDKPWKMFNQKPILPLILSMENEGCQPLNRQDPHMKNKTLEAGEIWAFRRKHLSVNELSHLKNLAWGVVKKERSK